MAGRAAWVCAGSSSAPCWFAGQLATRRPAVPPDVECGPAHRQTAGLLAAFELPAVGIIEALMLCLIDTQAKSLGNVGAEPGGRCARWMSGAGLELSPRLPDMPTFHGSSLERLFAFHQIRTTRVLLPLELCRDVGKSCDKTENKASRARSRTPQPAQICRQHGADPAASRFTRRLHLCLAGTKVELHVPGGAAAHTCNEQPLQMKTPGATSLTWCEK
ncbi:hypothetical protein Q8A73_023316 [Channa argus]|nr:hypothetical protein Q8A73_023316 [Channa argus]